MIHSSHPDRNASGGRVDPPLRDIPARLPLLRIRGELSGVDFEFHQAPCSPPLPGGADPRTSLPRRLEARGGLDGSRPPQCRALSPLLSAGARVPVRSGIEGVACSPDIIRAQVGSIVTIHQRPQDLVVDRWRRQHKITQVPQSHHSCGSMRSRCRDDPMVSSAGVGCNVLLAQDDTDTDAINEHFEQASSEANR